MTNEEIFKKIKQYESKWGKLGHTNIMNPEKNTIYHSGTNKDISQGGNKTMSRMDNELYKFRQKVAAGKEANKLAHKSYISPDELNKMNYDQLMNSHTLIHAANPTKGQQRENVKYYRREGQPGNYTYYYTKEEWDNRGANNAHSNAQDQAKADASNRWKYETRDKRLSGEANFVRKMESDAKGEQMDRDLKYVDSLKKDISEGVRDVVHDRKNPVGKLMDYIEDAFDDGELRMDEKGNMSGDEKVIAKIQEMSKEAEDYGKNLGNNLGEEGSKKVWNEFQKQTGDRVSKLTKAYNMKDEATKIFDEKGEDGVADYLAETDEWKNIEKEARKLISEGKLRLNKDNSGFNNISKDENKALDNLFDEIEDYMDVMRDGTGIPRSVLGLLEERLIKLAQEHSTTKYEKLSNGKDNYNTGDKKFKDDSSTVDYKNAKNVKERENANRKYENKMKNGGYRGNDNNPERDRYAKHSSDDSKALITNSNMGDEIMDEYSAFQEKVKRGREMNRIAHSTFISPSDLNARYEKDLEKEGILVHAGNYKYYNKIDLPNGTTRYFYTKAEWDAYQDGQGQAAKKKQDEMVKKNADAAAHEGDRYVKKSLPESATMTDKERKEMYEGLAKKAKIHNQQIETFRKNAEAAKHEGDRFIKDVKDAIKDSTKNTPEPTKTPESEVPKQDNVEEQKKQEAANKEIEKRNTMNYITETFNTSELAENWAQAVAFTDVYGADESAKKVLADNNVSMDSTIEDVMNQLREVYGEDAAQEFFNNAQAILQEKYNKYYTLYISQKNATDQANLANQQMMNQMMFGY